MHLFKDKILAQYAQDEQQIEQCYAALQAFQSKAEDIRHFKEEQYQTGFLEDIFEKCLGYTLKIHNPKQYNLEREKKDETDGKKADAVIYNTQGEVIGVIELKDQKTQDLEKVVSQAFHYHRNHEQSKYIIISNFNELRFYIDKQTAYEEFNLFTMNKDEFRRFYLILNYQSILHDLPIKLKQQTDNADNDISKKLYADFSAFRLQLFENAKQNNPNIPQKKLLRFIQKFCDRIIFILFAEDKGLLKPNTIAEIGQKHTQIKGIAEISLYQIYQKYFQAIDKGSTDLGIMPYNGGLFREDSELNQLTISDDILGEHLPKLSAYDFKSDISVNILGHIFEQSLSDLEELNAAIDNQQFDYNQSKRKKDGIFYTPEYITQFIVEQTIGKICEEKKQALGLNEEIRLPEKIKKKLNKEEQNLLDRLYQYRNFLLELKIIDPACGSGAFLNQALEFLIKEHAFIDKYRRILENESLGLYDIEIAILENNLYGVDINADAVEIAKLSLWLRTAQKGRKLTDLSNNIKCGNSLIDDKTVDKNAFIWQNEFPQIMANGGFDIVIGNPPYGAELSIFQKEYIKNTFQVFEYQVNSYVLFYELGFNILKHNGLLGYITPATFSTQFYYRKIRDLIVKYNIITLSRYMYEVFSDASIGDTISIIVNKSENKKQNIKLLLCKNENEQNSFNIEYNNFVDENGVYNFNNSYFNFNKLNDKTIRLDKLCNVTVGIKAYQKGKGEPKQTEEIVKNKIFTANNKKDNSYIQCVNGKDFYRYVFLNEPTMYLSYGIWLAEPRTNAPFFDDEKIIIRQTADRIIATIDDKKRINLNNVYNVGLLDNNYSIKYLLTLLNSKLINYFYQSKVQEENRVFPEVKKVILGQISIKIISLEKQQPFIELADKMLSLNAELNDKKSRFMRRLQQNFANIKIKGGLTQFWQLSFADFVNELKKQKIKLTLAEQDEWEDYFTQYQNHCTALQQTISQTDKTIDQMVYQLYGLTDEEIKIVEQA